MSLRRRLLAGFLGVAAVLVVVNVALTRIVERRLLERVDRQLVDVASRPIFRDGGREGRAGARGFAPGDETLSEYFIAVGKPGDQTLSSLTSAFADTDDPPPRLDRAQLLANLGGARARGSRPFTAPAQNGRGEWRLVAVGNARTGSITVVGLSLGDVRTTITRIRIVQAGGTLAALATLGLVSWGMLRLAIHPIENMARTADEIAGGDLSQRVEHPAEGTEAGRLGVAFNSMLERIEAAFRDKEASEERVRQFAADASHELRTPLTSIQGYAELYRAGGLRGRRELDDAMRRIEEEGRRMGALVEDLLLLARLDQRRPLDHAPVRLDEIAVDGVRDTNAVEPDRPITCDVEPVTVEGDELRLRQVVANLLANARIHTPPGTPIAVGVQAVDGLARLVVADEGPGMTQEVASKVFDRFFRGDSARTRSAGGTGLGLSIVDAVARAHGGRATVEARPGSGSRFVVELPVRAGSWA